MDLQRFVTLYIKSELIGKREADAVVAAFYAGRRKLEKSIELDEFCSFLILSKRLTRWQSGMLLVGKWKGFYVDDYVILEPVGESADTSSFKARNTKNETVVLLNFLHGGYRNGRFTYDVEPFVE